jgi:hypothetical protein
MVKKALHQYVSELISDRLKPALSNEAEVSVKETAAIEAPKGAAVSEEPKTEFTELEQEAFFIMKSILRTKVSGDRLFYRDTVHYLSILLDDNNRKPVCRLHLNGSKKYLGLMENGNKETRIEITSIDNIYDYSEQLIGTLL